MNYIIYIVCALLVWNIAVFIIYGKDKQKALNRKRRISEKTLLLSAFLMGGIGAMLSMWHFRHKTKHWEFKVLVPLFAILNIAAAVGGYYLITR